MSDCVLVIMTMSAVQNTSELSACIRSESPADSWHLDMLQLTFTRKLLCHQVQCHVIESNHCVIGVQELQITTTALYARELMVLKSYLPEGIVINSGGVRGLKRDLYKRMHLHGMASLFLDWKYKSYT